MTAFVYRRWEEQFRRQYLAYIESLLWSDWEWVE